MALNRKSSPGQQPQANSTVEYENLPEGEYEGRLVYVSDLGLQEDTWNKGDKKRPPCQKIALCIEILGKHVTIDGVKKPRTIFTKPFNIYYSMSSELGFEYQFYKVFNNAAKVGDVADWDMALGMPCNVVIEHNKAKNGNVYDNIKELTSIPAKYRDSVPASEITDHSVGDCDDDNNPAQKAIRGYLRGMLDRRITATKKVSANVASAEDTEFDDAIPF